MVQQLIIQGNKELKGEVIVRGSKNAAGAILFATLLTKEECLIDNLPLVSDIMDVVQLLESMGARVEWVAERKVKIQNKDINPSKIDFAIASRIRLSTLLIGALINRFGDFKISRPGGDRIGLRPITTHLKALAELGVEAGEGNGFYSFRSDGLQGKEIVMSEFSVTATENVLMASCLARGKTVIKGAAAEPEVQNLAEFLKKLGAKIEGEGTHTILVEGVANLGSAEIKVIPDRVEAGTFLVIGALKGDGVKIKNVVTSHLDLFLAKIKELGARIKTREGMIEVFPSAGFKPARVQAFPYPGFPTDLLPLIVPILTQAQGKSLVHDPLYENRFNYVLELRKMGADIEIVDPHRAFVFGKTPLRGVKIESWDIRAGASLVVAGLLAQGETVIGNVGQIDRGYEKIEERLQGLGADIKRVQQ